MHRLEAYTHQDVLDAEQILIDAIGQALQAVCDEMADRIGHIVVAAAAEPTPEQIAQAMVDAAPAGPPGQPYVSVDDLAAMPGLWTNQVQNLIMPLTGQIYRDAAGKLHAEMVDLVGPQVPSIGSQVAEDYLAGAANRWDFIGNDVWETARTELLDGFQQGESIPKLAARVRSTAALSQKRAEAVARTEVVSASNAGSYATAQVSGLEMDKVWLATNDGRTRPSHVVADGQKQPLNQPFSVGGSSLSFPGDPGGAPAETHNCRCTLIYEIPDDRVRPDRPAEPAAPAAARDRGAETIARQADIDTARPVGDIASQFAERERLLLDNEVGVEEFGQALAERVETLATMARNGLRPGGRLPEGLDAVEAAARTGDADKMRAAIADMSRLNHVSLQGHAYERVEFDRATQKLLVDDGRTGGEVTIIRPRAVLQRDGETIELSKAIVADIPAADHAAALQRIARTLESHRAGPGDLELANRLRQADVDAARAVAEVNAEIDELLNNMGDRIDWDVVARGINATARRAGLPGQTRDQLLSHIGDADALRAAADRAAADAGLTPIDRAGDIVSFDPKRHEATAGVRLRPGQLAEVIRGGHVFRRGEEDIRLARAVVDEAPPGSRLTLRPMPTAPAAPEVTFVDRQAAVRVLSEQTPTATRQLGGGVVAHTDLLTYGDDRKLVSKVYGPRQRDTPAEIKRQTDAETLGAMVLDALDVRAPATISTGRGRLLMEHLDGETGAERSFGPVIPESITGSEDGIRMGLADLVMLNTDRNSGNWLIQEGGRLAGLDHGYAFAARTSLANSIGIFDFPFARFAIEQVDGKFLFKQSFRLPGVDLARARTRLESLRTAFDELGRGAWHRAMMARLAEIERRVQR